LHGECAYGSPYGAFFVPRAAPGAFLRLSGYGTSEALHE